MFESDPGVDLSSPDELTHYHLSGLTSPNGGTALVGLCNETVPDDFNDGWWVKDTIVADTVPRIKSCAFADRSVRPLTHKRVVVIIGGSIGRGSCTSLFVPILRG